MLAGAKDQRHRDGCGLQRRRRYGAIFWVKPEAGVPAAKLLGRRLISPLASPNNRRGAGHGLGALDALWSDARMSLTGSRSVTCAIVAMTP